MTLGSILDALHARGAVALTLFPCSAGFQASARGEGTGWTVGVGATAEDAVTTLIEQYRYTAAGRGKSRYFELADGRLLVTWNGQPRSPPKGSGARWM